MRDSARAVQGARGRSARSSGLLIGVGIFVGLLALIIPSFADQAQEFVDEVPAIVDDVEATVADITGSEPSEVGLEVQEFLQRYTDDPGEFIGPLASLGLSVAGVVGALRADADHRLLHGGPSRSAHQWCRGALPARPPAWARTVISRLRASWIGWMEGVVFDMVLTGVLLYVGLTLIGLDFASSSPFSRRSSC